MHAPITTGAARGAAIDPAVAAWLAAAVAAVLVPLAMLALGPPLGGVLFSAHGIHFWSDLPRALIRPEPTEQARFLIALTAPLVLVGLTFALVRRAPRIAPGTGARLVLALESTAALAVVAAIASQWLYRYSTVYTNQPHIVYFRLPTLIVALALGGALAAGARAERVRARVAAWAGAPRAWQVAALALALLLIVVTVLPALSTDGSVARGNADVTFHLDFTFEEANAVLDGRTPIGDFAAQYGSLWPYLTAGGMAILGASLAVFTALMAAITGAAMLALLATLRRLTRSATTALLLFAPLLATCAYEMHGNPVDRFSLITYFGTMPLRYAGPFLLVWLTARHLDGARPRRAWPLFVLGGLVAINNTDFGIVAVAATIVALLYARGRPTAAGVRELAREAALGLAAAAALVTVLVLARTGGPPHPGLLFRYARIYAVGGFALVPVRPVFGLSSVILLTYLAAIGVATVRAIRREPDRLLTALLVWSGIFGLGAGGYYVGRSVPEVLEHEFPAWAFSLTLLTLLTLRRLAAAPHRRPSPLALACLVGFGVLVCSLAQTPAPWSQVARLSRHGPPIFKQSPAWTFVGRYARRGEHVAVLMPLGFRMGVRYGLDNVDVYTGSQSIQTQEQLDDTIDALRRAGGRRLFLSERESGPEMLALLQRRHFRLVAEEPATTMELWERR